MTKQHTPSATQRFVGALLMAVGGLIAILCGGCGALFVVGGLISSSPPTLRTRR